MQAGTLVRHRMPPTEEEDATSRGGLSETHLPQSRDNWQKALNGYRDLPRRKEQQYWNGRIGDTAAAQNPGSL